MEVRGLRQAGSAARSFLVCMQALEINAATLNSLPDEGREALLQRLLEQKLRSFATQVSMRPQGILAILPLASLQQGLCSSKCLLIGCACSLQGVRPMSWQADISFSLESGEDYLDAFERVSLTACR